MKQARIINRESFYFGQVAEVEESVQSTVYPYMVKVVTSGGVPQWTPFAANELEFLPDRPEKQ